MSNPARKERKLSVPFKIASQRNWQKSSIRGMRLRLRQIQLTVVGDEYQQLKEVISLLDKVLCHWNKNSRAVVASQSTKLQTKEKKGLDNE